METEKLPIIYILSLTASGSTLLDLLLGAHPNIWTTGEAHTLPQQLTENRPCGCGASLIGCEFWQSVLHKISLNSSSFSIDYFRRKGTEDKFLRWSRFLGLIRVIYLMKDPRAFVYSMVKVYSTDKIDLQNTPQSAPRFARRWLVSNGLALILCKNRFPRDHVICFRYEQVAGAPQSTLNEISNLLGLGNSNKVIKAFRNCEYHAIAGNRMRWQTTNIYLDEKWKEALPRRHGLISWLITWPLARLYGFRRGGSIEIPRSHVPK